MKKELFTSGSPYEKTFGFSRAVKVGNLLVVSGTGPIASDGSTSSVGDAYGQTMRCLQIIKDVIEEAGGQLDNVIRTRMYITDATLQNQIGKAHGEYFSEIRPAATMVVVKGLVRDDWYVEIEADCIID